MAQPVFIIALTEIIPRMRSATLSPSLSSNSSCLSDLKKILQLKRLNTRRVERRAFIFKVDVIKTLPQGRQLLHAFLHEVTTAEYAKVILHHLLQLRPQRRNTLTGGRLIELY